MNNNIINFVIKNKIAVIITLILMAIGIFITTTNYFFGAIVLVPKDLTTITENQISTERGFNLDTKDGNKDLNIPIYFKPSKNIAYFAAKISIDTSLLEFKENKCTLTHNTEVPKTGADGNYTILNNADLKSSTCTAKTGNDYIYLEINPTPGNIIVEKGKTQILAVVHLRLKNNILPGSYPNAIEVGDPENWMNNNALSSSTTLNIDVQAIAPNTSISPKPGTYNSAQTIVLTCSQGNNPCKNTYYTLDGSDPTTGSLVYKNPIIIENTTTIKYFSIDTNGQAENIKSATYVIEKGQTGNLACGTSSGNYVLSLNENDLCINGTVQNKLFKSNYWTWECKQNTQIINCKAMYGMKKQINVFSLGSNNPLNNAIIYKDNYAFTSNTNNIDLGITKSGQDLLILTSSGLDNFAEPMVIIANLDDSNNLVTQKLNENLIGNTNGSSNISLKIRGDMSNDGNNNVYDGIANIFDSIYIYKNAVFNSQNINYTISNSITNNDGKTFTFGINGIENSTISGVTIYYKFDDDNKINNVTVNDNKYTFNFEPNKSGILVIIKSQFEPFIARFEVTNTGKINIIKLNNTFGKITALGQYIQLAIRNDISSDGENLVSDGKVDIHDAIKIYKNSINF